MPPRKSNVSAVSATGEEGTPVKERDRDGVNVEDLALPKTMVQRLAKGVLPSNTRIEKDAITAMSKSATVFVNYLSNGANDRTLTTNRKTISPNNVLEALADLEFKAFLPRVEAELRRFNEIQTGKRNEYRRKLKEGKEGDRLGRGRGRKSANGADATNGLEDDDEPGPSEVEVDDEGGERALKRMRRHSGSEHGPEIQLVDRGKGREQDEGDTAVDAAIEAADAALREEDEGEDEDEEDEEDEDEDEDEGEHDEEEEESERWHNPLEDADEMIDQRAIEEGLESPSDANTPPTESDEGDVSS